MTKPIKPNRNSPGESYSVSRKDAEADALFLSIGEGTIAIDEYGKISSINQIALDVLGFKEKDIIGKWYTGTVIAEDENGQVIPHIERPITQVFLTGKPIRRRIYYRCKNGNRVPVALTVSPVLLRGKPIGAVEVFRDITEELELENAKDEFISIASHQLRTPATVVKQYLGMLVDGYMGELSETQLSVLMTAYDYNDQQLDTISDLLKVAQADANRTKMIRKNVDVVKLVRSVVDSQALDYSKKDIGLNFQPPAKTFSAIIDPLHLKMVLENLLDNARKYSPDGTHVSVELETHKQQFVIHVIDQGYGIAKSDISKLFQKFSRLNNPKISTNGTGLGLYWAKKLVELHDGDMSVSSRLGKGTTFSVRIPRGQSA